MVNFNIAYTSRINPAGATPVLNQAQIWAGLQRKIRFAQEFVPVIESCDVLEEKDGVVTRDVKFKKGMGPKDQAKEVVRSYWPSWVDFEQEDGTHIRNIVSDGPSGEIEDLNMTYMFEFVVPHVQEGTPEAEKEIQKFKGMAKKAVESSIDAIREMVKDGRIKE
ncbi:uncharacterized protein J4E88_000407 [Alternaria novae-zelandiae]|uniref:uncharacterized protein n=1 Tax=Alternaria metachromatica TaxID=283354 RepID=UPI0020C4E10D|nr:uncharacterized protein J4E83_003130 [Alternaria metachromatica]XP_049229648.1 uncharacterized protein J4E87_009004 [Alternaria ethzedia]XP_049259914.1 uncharacterized protein J4E88_000407 [Alternaria novae-zelandiae]KAI4615546.1 hypothetical protein J4E87_009004 [Alternaria ethzedia]KAI4628579.1 hypothetical protein J4E83_003130 [Alternaria metachromatica]KAI4696234.1 hypothetical protein J4E88_000407 [Alternaria novae-zelandiae]